MTKDYSRLALYDKMLYKAKYVDESDQEYERIWEEIKNDLELLEASIEVTFDEERGRNSFQSNVIAEAILRHANEVNPRVYLELVEKILSDKDLARIVIDGYDNGGMSFLLLTIMNYSLMLDDEQKKFAIDEAMNMPDTKRDLSIERPVYPPEGYDWRNSDFWEMATSGMIENASTKNAHLGRNTPDIRFFILVNFNFSMEFSELLEEFYPEQNYYEEELRGFALYFTRKYSDEEGNCLFEEDSLLDMNTGKLRKQLNGRSIDEINSATYELLAIQKMHTLRPPRDEYTSPIISEKIKDEKHG